LPLSRVDEIKEESEIGVKSKLPLLPRAAIIKTRVGQFCALRVGQSCALSSIVLTLRHWRPCQTSPSQATPSTLNYISGARTSPVRSRSASFCAPSLRGIGWSGVCVFLQSLDRLPWG